MPRTVRDIIDHADDLAKRFEDYEPAVEHERDPEVFIALRQAVMARAAAERSITAAIKLAREGGFSWALIGSLIGTCGEAVRQRYGHRTDV